MKRIESKVLTHHRATHRNGGSNGLCEVIAGTVGLETGIGLLDELLVATQAGGIVEIA
jgi:hypothetical protein